MYRFNKIIETKEVSLYLTTRWLVNQYKKAKTYLQLWLFLQVKFGLREPKKDEIYYFRINKKYRALCIIENDELRVYKISDHQE